MTARSPRDRFAAPMLSKSLSIAFGWILATTRGVRPIERTNVPAMTTSLELKRGPSTAQSFGVQLREEALDVASSTHRAQQMRDIRNSAVTALVRSHILAPAIPDRLPVRWQRESVTFASARRHGGRSHRQISRRSEASTLWPNIANQLARIRSRVLKDVSKDVAYATVQKTPQLRTAAARLERDLADGPGDDSRRRSMAGHREADGAKARSEAFKRGCSGSFSTSPTRVP